MEIKLSVIIPIYNMERYLSECLDSVLSQSLKDIEIICIDDGSTDATKDILERYQNEYKNISVLYQNRQGAGPARNRGIEFSNGEFIAFMDSDDYYPSDDVLECLYNGAINNNVLMAGGSHYNIINGIKKLASDNLFTSPEENATILSSDYQNIYGFSCFIYNTKMLKDNSIRFPNYIRNQDPPFKLDALIAADSIWITGKPVYVCRQVDKKVEYTSKKVAFDIADAFLKMMRKTNRYSYFKSQKSIIDFFYSDRHMFIVQLMNGNDEISYILEQIGNEILDKDLQDYFVNYWEKSNVEREFFNDKGLVDEVTVMIHKYKKILIYGAGEYGKQLYDYVSSIDNIDFLGFAVSDETPEGTARGYEIKPLSQYIKYSKECLVIIAKKNDINDEMHDFANNLGFEHIIHVNSQIGYIGLNLITDGYYAYDN